MSPQGGSIRIYWSAATPATVNITRTGGVSFKVNGSAVTFPYTLTTDTQFDTTADGTYTVSVISAGREIANTPDGTRVVELSAGALLTLKPSIDNLPQELVDYISDQVAPLKAWAKNPDQLVAGTLTYSSGLLSSATVEWPDGKTGILNITSRQSGTDAVTGYTVTRVEGTTTKTYTQPTITRDPSGAATNVPQITVA